MKCPHCNSLMQVYQVQTNEISQVAFYRCTVCIGEHVSSSLLTAHQFDTMNREPYTISGNRSQFAEQSL